MAPFTDLDFLTQMEQNAWTQQDIISPSLISETPAKTSGHHNITSSCSVQEVTSTAAPMSHCSDEQIEQADQSEVNASSCSVQEVSLTAAPMSHCSEEQIEQADQSEVNADPAALEHSPALNNDPMRKMFTSVEELLLIEGCRLAVLHQAFDEAVAKCLRYLGQNRSDPTRSEQSTTDHIVMVIGQDPDVEKNTAPLAQNKVQKSRLTLSDFVLSDTPSDDEDEPDLADSELYVPGKESDTQKSESDTSEYGSDTNECEPDTKESESGTKESELDTNESESDAEESESAMGPPTLADLMELKKLKKLKKRYFDEYIRGRVGFRTALKAWHVRTIKVGESAFNLHDLAAAALTENQINKERPRRRNRTIKVGETACNPLDLAVAAVKERPRRADERETWQLLFNIIASLLVLGLEPLTKTIEAIRESPASHRLAAKSSHQGKRYKPSATDQTSGITKHEKALARLTQSICLWVVRERKSSLDTVYDYYDKLQTVNEYEERMHPLNQQGTKELLEEKGIRLGRKRLSTALFEYLSQQAHGEGIEISGKDLAAKISQFRPVYALVKAFGQGVLVLVGGSPQNLLNNISASWLWTVGKRHERLSDAAMSLKKADEEVNDGQLSALFTDLGKKVLEPALHCRAHKNTDGWLIDYPGWTALEERTRVGERMAILLGRIKWTNPCSDDVPAQAGERPSKRRISSSGMEEAAEGVQCTNKRTKVT